MKVVKKLSKSEVEEEIKEIFRGKPSAKEIKKVKRLAMSRNIKLRDLRKRFCRKCLRLFDSSNSEVRVKKGFKVVRCKGCGYVGRYKLK